jgi:hypothetical protein
MARIVRAAGERGSGSAGAGGLAHNASMARHHAAASPIRGRVLDDDRAPMRRDPAALRGAPQRPG